ncbi:WD40 repeat protein [Colletotrichum fioriniae]|uniref:WD40 repeat protein n=1 Tax=Colletotrichum fioriniae TaxID=710243 RepID=UPI0032D9EEC4|nr:WD40 repeat protein [Colletotrichum fioriniae]
MDSEAQVYKPYFPSYANIQRRRQNHHGQPGSTAPDQYLWGPGEGQGVRDVSVRFRMVIKVDAGIESALALDDELVVATRKPGAIQCIRWTPDQSGSQTKTEIISRMGWLEKKITVIEMTHDRPMNLSTWTTSDGKVYAVQRLHPREEADPKKLFKGYCFHTPAKSEDGWATWSVYGKPGSNSFGAHDAIIEANGENWISGIGDAVWLGSGSEILITHRKHEAIWVLEMARSAVVGNYNAANLMRTVLQTSTNVMIYRGYDLPDLASISAEPHLWHTTKVPSAYLLQQWPIRHTVISPDGRYVAVAGRRGLAHYSVNSGRWKTFANDAMENEFQVRGSMCWYQHILVAAVEANKSHELRLYSRETALDNSQVLHTERLPAPAVLVTTSGEDSLLVYTYDNLLYHFIFAPTNGSIRLVQLGQIAFHGIVRSPARVRGLSWILPDSQLVDGDPSQDVAVASVLFLVDAKLVRQWRTLFAYLPPVQELFEESLQRGSLKTAGGYLIILHTLDELGSASEQTVRLLSRAMKEGDWELCKELARFLAAMDETGDTLREAMEGVNISMQGNKDQSGLMSRLDVPHGKAVNGLGLKYIEQSDEMESEGQSVSSAASFSSDGR